MGEGLLPFAIAMGESKLLMVARTTSSFILIHAPFNLKGYKETLPPGRYKIVTEEIWIEGLSFRALQRVQVRLELQKSASRPNTTETLVLDDPQDLYAALNRDKAANETASEVSKIDFKT